MREGPAQVGSAQGQGGAQDQDEGVRVAEVDPEDDEGRRGQEGQAAEQRGVGDQESAEGAQERPGSHGS